MADTVVAVLDTCVLYPATLRDTLLLAAEAGAFQLRWTDQIIIELRRNLIENRAAPAANVERMLSNFAEFFDDGRVTGYEHHVAGLANHPKDRHVVAAAIEGGAEFIVTQNLKDFPANRLPQGIVAVAVDEFLGELLERSPAAMVETLWTQALRKRKPPVAVERIVEAVGRVAPRFSAGVRPFLEVRSDAQRAALVERLTRAVDSARGRSGTEMIELGVALADACVAFPDLTADVTSQVTPLAPVAVRTLASVARTGSPEDRAAAEQVLRSRGIDVTSMDVLHLSDEQILALLELGASTTH